MAEQLLAPFMKTHQNLFLRIYLISIASAAALSYFISLPESYFSNKRNIINMALVKYGWGWTLVILLPLIILSNKPVKYVFYGLIRVFCATLYWLFCVKVMNYVLQYTGDCDIQDLTTIKECKTNGGIWNGFDISGHIFLLLHSSLVIIEELYNSGVLDQVPSDAPRSIYTVICMVGSIVLLGIWWFMLLVTCVYFHPISEILAGTFFGILFWKVVYVKIKCIYS
jgi:hypothetical protein